MKECCSNHLLLLLLLLLLRSRSPVCIVDRSILKEGGEDKDEAHDLKYLYSHIFYIPNMYECTK